MRDDQVKKEFAKVIFNAKVVAGLFFLVLAPNIVITIKELDGILGLAKDVWFNAALAAFVIYGGFTFLYWKCPKCKKFPGRGWFRKNCNNCGVELT